MSGAARPRPRYAVGIDLGTTNSALAWADLDEALATGVPRVHRFDVLQVVGDGEVETVPTLPSFLYFPTPDERAAARLTLPWSSDASRVVGAWARDHGALLPGRLVTSVKSWLCHGNVDRRAAILPWEADSSARVLSPVEASTAYLAHLRDAWNYTMAAGADDRRLERQDIVLTVPASFDEEARELTVDAARAAGFDRLTLQEEPTAALYAWIASHRRELGQHLRGGDTVLVCDVGGGTTDFTLVTARIEADEFTFERVAVGEHLLLGGDNLDLALARHIEAALTGPPLTLRQRHALRRQSAAAKEALLSAGGGSEQTISILGAGRALVGGTQTATLRLEDVRRALVDGFLPDVAAGERPRREARFGLRELGLPYEQDPAITRHLSAFLGDSPRDVSPGPPRRPDAVLLNGGFFTPALARDRLVEVIRSWFADDPDWTLRVLSNESPATAVAEGAACYGLVRHGSGVRIGGGSPRAYYIGVQAPSDAHAKPRVETVTSGVDSPQPPAAPPDAGSSSSATSVTALCVLPRGTEEGTRRALEAHAFEVVANRPRAFSLWSSRTRRDDFGDLVALAADEAHAHAPLVAEFRYGKRSRAATVPVRLEVGYTELGTLKLWVASRDTEHRWRLQFELRGGRGEASTGNEAQAIVPEESMAAAASAIQEVFGPGGAALVGAQPVTPEQLPSFIEATFGLGRHAWPVPVIRRLADALLEAAEGRRSTARHESRWLNLLGFCLRPGFGAALDDYRMTQARRIYLAGIAFPADVQNQAEWLVLWQRIAGGLTAGQQQDVYHRHGPPLFASLQKKGRRLPPQVERETWRLLASLERLPPATRGSLGAQIVARLQAQPDSAALWWSLGRVGARTPFHGPLNTVVDRDRVSQWIDSVIALRPLPADAIGPLVDLAALTGDAARDLDEGARTRVADTLRDAGASDELVAGLYEVRGTSRADLQRRFGETLPEGLQLAVGSRQIRS